MRPILILICALTLMPEDAAAREPLTDHALVAPYEGSVIRRKKVQEFDEYRAFTGMDEAGKTARTIDLEGKITKIFYTKPKERSILEVFRNYETAVAQAGAEILYTCNQEKKECVQRYAGPTLQKTSDIHAISNLAGRYLLAKMHTEDHTAYIAIAVGQQFTDIHVIELKEMDTGMVTLDAAALGKGLEARGYVIVEGIYFDTDEASLRSESSAALEQVAELLRTKSDLSVFVVGHTDMQGSLAHNVSLSQRRAAAVVAELASSYRIAADRLDPHGVGPLAPQASNEHENGRALNRRVVLVAR